MSSLSSWTSDTQENQPSSPPTSITPNGTTSSNVNPWWMPYWTALTTTARPSAYPDHPSESPPIPNLKIKTLPRKKHQNQRRIIRAPKGSINKTTKGSIFQSAQVVEG